MPKAGARPPLQQYCSDLVPFLVSDNPVPSTYPSEIFLGASPTEFLKYRMPNAFPQPKVWLAQIMDPAEEPEQTRSSLSNLSLTTCSKELGVPSSFSQERRCLSWSPPLKKTISACRTMSALAFPWGVLISEWILKLSRWRVRCLGARPYLRKRVLQDMDSVSFVQESFPSAYEPAAEVATAILGHLVVSQFQSHLLGWAGRLGMTFPRAVKT